MCKDNNIDHINSEDLNIINSTLFVKCSGIDMEHQIQQDLNLPEGKSIAELIYDQEENRPNQNN